MAIYKSHFYHGLIKTYTIVMGSLLDGIDVVRFGQGGVEDSRVRVPVTYSNKEKFIQRIHSDPDLLRQPAIVLPRIAFEMVGMQYNPDRKLSGKHQFAYPNGVNGSYSIYTPVPYDFTFSVTIVAKTQTDALQIVEQLVPFFTPDYHVAVKGIGTPEISYDVGITLLTINPMDNYEGEFEERRTIQWNLSFLLRGFLFGPVREGHIIKTVDISLYDMSQLNLPANLQQYYYDYQFVPYINGVPLLNIASTDPWTVNTQDRSPFDPPQALYWSGDNWYKQAPITP
jgi:hypothetical protein